jgi:hypothetical protein
MVAKIAEAAIPEKTPPAARKKWLVALGEGLDDCRRQDGFFRRTVCAEKMRWKYCSPDRWDTVPECATE